MTRVNFRVNEHDKAHLHQIAVRASFLAQADGFDYPVRDALMDVTACHCNGCPLRLAELVSAPDHEFGHDVFGIRKYIDRKTGKLTDFFDPRHSAPAPTPAQPGYGPPGDQGRWRKVHYFIPDPLDYVTCDKHLISLCAEKSIYLPTYTHKLGSREDWRHVELCVGCDRMLQYPTHLGERAALIGPEARA